MRLGIFIHSVKHKGGQARVVANLCRGWIDKGWDVHLITIDGDQSPFAIPGAVVRHTLLSRSRRSGIWRIWDNILTIARLGRLARRLDLSGMLAFSSVESVMLALSRCPRTTVKLGSEHNYARHYPMPWTLGAFRKIFYPRLDAMVCPASQTAEALRSDCPGTHVITIPNLLVWPSRSRPIAASADNHAMRHRVVTCGRLVPDKGFDVAMRAFSRVSSRHPNWDMLVIGEGPAEESLKDCVANLGMSGRISFAGFSEQAHEIYERCDFFVYASSQEGFGMVIAEAQASGLPVVCFDCLAGPRDIVDDQVTGRLVEVGDLNAFCEAMDCLMKDEDLRNRMGRAAMISVSKLGPEKVIPMWEDAFKARRIFLSARR